MASKRSDGWDPGLYSERHSFVFEYGEELTELADVRPGERVLDVGCGTGQLTARLAELGADVLGIDSSPAMVEAARKAYPTISFEVADVVELDIDSGFDLVFSNAVLHWVKRAQTAANAMATALRPGGRLVAELGGRGNIAAIKGAVDQAVAESNISPEALAKPWFYPSLAEYVAILTEAGLEVTFAHLFPRPTPLDGDSGLRDWLEMFVRSHFSGLSDEAVDSVLSRAVEIAAPSLRNDGVWHADYVRLRITAVKDAA